MTDEEWERLKDANRASVPDQPDKEASEARRKNDRDLDRI